MKYDKISTGIALLYLYYSDVIMSALDSQITGLSIVCSSVCSGADQRKHQGSASLVFVRGIHRSPVDSPHKGPVTQKMFSLDDVIRGYKVWNTYIVCNMRFFLLTMFLTRTAVNITVNKLINYDLDIILHLPASQWSMLCNSGNSHQDNIIVSA